MGSGFDGTRRIRPGLSQKLASRKGMAENAKAGKNKIGVNQRPPRLTISSCLSAFVVNFSKKKLDFH
jgi:hypothetical protein